ncbi:heavy metal-associated isoprenylated plant protein 8-like [Salvia splendens]|nr:heavy metal-associated isoprenylated plant protein 8-like [Salvia splendens]
MSVEHQKVEMEHNDHDHPNGVIILRVYIHCEGCGDEVFKCLRGYQGVDGVEIDAKNQKVIIKGEKADPIKLSQRLRKKTGKHVELIHPKLPKQDKEKEKTKEPPETIEVVLKINMHCDGCAKEVKCCIYDMEGVERVDVDVEKNVARVKGNMDPHKLVEFISNRGGRTAEIVQTDSINGEEKGKGEDRSCNCYASQQAVYAPQIFSDENPNACSVM